MPRAVHSLAVFAGLIALASVYPVLSAPQPVAGTLADLAQTVSVGQAVTVTDAAGSEIKGRITRQRRRDARRSGRSLRPRLQLGQDAGLNGVLRGNRGRHRRLG